MMKIRLFLLALLGGCLATITAPSAVAKRPPNIVLFLVDDMGWQDTSVPFAVSPTPFNKRYHTPNMEKLDGVLALQLHAGAPMWCEYKDIRIKGGE